MSDTEQEAQLGSQSQSGQGPYSEEQSNSNAQERIAELKKVKRIRKTAVTKLRHSIEKRCVKKDDIDTQLVEKQVENLWDLLEKNMDIMDELSSMYAKIGEHENKQACSKEADVVETEVLQAIEKAECVIKDVMKDKSKQTSDLVNSRPQVPIQENPVSSQISVTQHSVSEESSVTGMGLPNSRLKPLKVPTFDGSKARFEDSWALFSSLVDQTSESVNIKMARLRQCLTGTALDTIRGLGVTQQEYEEAKAILHTKFGGKRRQLHAYMYQLEVMPP